VSYPLYHHRRHHTLAPGWRKLVERNYLNPTNQYVWDRICNPFSSNQGSRYSLRSSSEYVMVDFRKSISARKYQSSKLHAQSLRSSWESS